MSGLPPTKTSVQQRLYYGVRRMLPGWLMEWVTWLAVSFGPEQNDAVPARLARFSLREKIPALERAKMDYRNRQSIVKLVLDKLVLSAFVGLAVLLASIYLDNRRDADVRALEAFKLDEAQRQILLVKRLDALNEVATTIGQVNGIYFDYTGAKKGAPAKEANEKYSEAVEKADKAIDKAEILFPPGFTKDMERYIQVHKKIRTVGVQKCGKYEDLVLDLYQRFGIICFDTITTKSGIENWIAHDQERLPLTFSAKERRGMSDQKYLDGQLQFWNENKDKERFKRRR